MYYGGYGYGGYGGYYGGYGYGYSGLYMIAMLLLVAALILAFYSQWKVNSTFRKYSQVQNRRGYTGADVARQLLYNAGITDVAVEQVRGNLTDHYDPKSKVLRLSETVFSSRSVAALGVAAHETGHAIQDNVGYVPLRARTGIYPAVSFSSKLAMPLIILGFLIGSFTRGNYTIALLGALLYAVVVFFQLVTLPVEFNASARAMRNLKEYGYLDEDEIPGARRVLSAAALTYVASAAAALATLLRFLAIILGNSGRRR
ncbi:MAG: zinc metallopeptidase [Clostridiales bacterium]|nr:zinc metallopeptidase [Clostridiales bacterium]